MILGCLASTSVPHGFIFVCVQLNMAFPLISLLACGLRTVFIRLVVLVDAGSLVYYLAECCEVSVFALHQELSCDVSGRLHLAGLFILLMQLLHFFLRSHHLNNSHTRG